MPQIFKKYKLTNEDSGESYVVSLPHEPTHEEIDQIFKLKNQEKSSLSQADQSQHFTWPEYKKAIIDSGIGLGKAAAITGGAAATTAISPIAGTLLGAGLVGYGTYQTGKKAYDMYNNKSSNTLADKVELGGNIAQTLLPFIGMNGKEFNEINVIGPTGPKTAGPRMNTASVREALNIEAINKATTPRNAEFVDNTNPNEPIDANVIPPYNPDFVHKPTPPPQLTTGNGTKQIEAPNAIPMPGEVQPPPPDNNIEVTRPKTGYYNRQVDFGNWGSTKARTRYYKGEAGKPVPSIVEQVDTLPEKLKDVTPPKVESLKVEEKQPEVKTEEQPISQKLEVKPETLKEEPTKLENNWLRQTDTQVLQNMQTGASGKLRAEIDNVLGERGIVKNQPKPKEEPPKPQESQLESGINEATFNEYNDILSNLPAHGKEIGSHILRDVAKLGKDAGLDSETVKNDILENLHPEITNPAGRVQIAIRRAFNSTHED